ncbi:MAG: DUF924 family protein, partial [Woeseia sp.]
MNAATTDEVLEFWFEDIEKVRWFKADPDFDRDLKERFGAALTQARNGELDHWCRTADGYLALIIVLDQFSRNIFRETADAFAADDKALQL